MKVRMVNPAPHLNAKKGDIVDIPEWQAVNWIARGTATAVDQDEVLEDVSAEVEVADLEEEEEESEAEAADEEIDLSEIEDEDGDDEDE